MDTCIYVHILTPHSKCIFHVSSTPFSPVGTPAEGVGGGGGGMSLTVPNMDPPGGGGSLRVPKETNGSFPTSSSTGGAQTASATGNPRNKVRHYPSMAILEHGCY